MCWCVHCCVPRTGFPLQTPPPQHAHNQQREKHAGGGVGGLEVGQLPAEGKGLLLGQEQSVHEPVVGVPGGRAFFLPTAAAAAEMTADAATRLRLPVRAAGAGAGVPFGSLRPLRTVPCPPSATTHHLEVMARHTTNRRCEANPTPARPHTPAIGHHCLPPSLPLSPRASRSSRKASASSLRAPFSAHSRRVSARARSPIPPAPPRAIRTPCIPMRVAWALCRTVEGFGCRGGGLKHLRIPPPSLQQAGEAATRSWVVRRRSRSTSSCSTFAAAAAAHGPGRPSSPHPQSAPTRDATSWGEG